jgi:hypothetical protein
VQQVEREVAGGLADALLLVLVDDVVLAVAPVPRVLPNVTLAPVSTWTSIATCSSTWPSQVPSSSRMRRMNPPSSPYEQVCCSRLGSAASRASTKPGIVADGWCSSSPRSRFRRITGKWA